MSDLKDPDDGYDEEETARRRDEALKRALNMPPKHHSEMKIGKSKRPANDPKTRPASKGRVHKGKSRS